MGNRAVVQFTHQGTATQAFYLHWNGGPESVYTFLAVLETDYRCRSDAAPARFAQLVGNFFGGGLSLYAWENNEPMDEDNGVYRVDTAQNPWAVAHDIPRPHGSLRTLTAAELCMERAAAAVHEYNQDDELRKGIRLANDSFFLGCQA